MSFMINKRVMIFTLLLFGLLMTVLIIGKLNLSYHFSQQVKELFAQSKNISNQKFSYEQLEALPEPVQRYFKHVLKVGQPYLSYIRLTHDGQFKTALDKNWIDIKGEQYFTTEKPGFIWKGNTTLFTARDMYMADKGRLVVSLLSLYNIVDGKGNSFNQGELLRWIAEGVWFPTNFLPSERLNWTAIDSNSAKLIFTYNGLSVFYIVTFNDVGEITQVETKRYFDEHNLETWIGKLTDYKELNGVFVPTKIEAIWRLKTGDFSYAKFNVIEIEYGNPKVFKL